MGIAKVVGFSMTGKLDNGAKVAYAPNENGEPYKIGDIIVFEKDGVYIIYEIVGIDQDSETGEIKYTTKGVNNVNIDFNSVFSYQIRGKVIDMSKSELLAFTYMAEQGRIPCIKARASDNPSAGEIMVRRMEELTEKIFRKITEDSDNDFWLKLGNEIANDVIDYETYRRNRDITMIDLYEKEIKSKITRMLLLESLELSPKFNIGNLNIQDGSIDAIENLNFLLELKKDYNIIPLEYRGIDSPEILLLDRVTDYPEIKEDNPHYNEYYQASGYYDSIRNKIVIATNLDLRAEAINTGSLIAHEMGHYVYFVVYNIDFIEELYLLFQSIRLDLLTTGYAQAFTNKQELFADAFAEFYTGELRLSRMASNQLRKDRGMIDIGEDEISTYGMLIEFGLNDFLEKYLIKKI